MNTNFNFWTPATIGFDHCCFENSYSQIKKGLSCIGQWADHTVYLGSQHFSIFSFEGLTTDCYHFSVKGRARLLTEKTIMIHQDLLASQKVYLLAFKVILLIFGFPFLIVIKACYKYLYIKRFFETQVPPPSLKELLKKYPTDPDLQCIHLCEQFDNLKTEFKTNSSQIYPKFKKFIQDIQTFNVRYPHHEHMKQIKEKLCSLTVHQTCFLNYIPDQNDWLEFFHFIRHQPETQCPDSLFKLFDEISDSNDKKNFKLLMQVYINQNLFLYPKTLDLNHLYNALWLSKTFITELGENQFLNLLNWLVSKEKTSFFLSTNGRTFLQRFYSQCLPSFKRPYRLALKDFEEKLLKLDNGFTREYQERKLLANLFGIKGKSAIGKTTFDLEGFRVKKGPFVPHSVKSSLNFKLNDYCYPILKSTLSKLKQTSPHPWLEQLDQTLSKKGIGGFSSFLCSTVTDFKKNDQAHAWHGWSQVRYKEYLLIGNQGYNSGDFPGILIFKIDPTHFKGGNRSKFKLIKQFETSSTWFGKLNPDFLKQEYFNGLNPQYIGYLPFPYQKIGNCPSKAFKLNLFSTLFILNGYDDLKKGKPFKEIEKNLKPTCASLTKQLFHPIREKLLKRYLKCHQTQIYPQKPDYELLEKIKKRAIAKKRSNTLLLFQKLAVSPP